MEMSYKYYALEFILRVFCGIIFMFQGYDKLFNIKIKGVVETFSFEAQQKHIPEFFLKLMAVNTSVTEFIGGMLLIFGLFKNYALCFLGMDMVVVAFAFSYMHAMWDMKFVLPRLLLVSIFFVTPNKWEFFSVDQIIRYFNK
jgi:uncharacterized membrane protein YphA (DoxX/SURF4 family)